MLKKFHRNSEKFWEIWIMYLTYWYTLWVISRDLFVGPENFSYKIYRKFNKLPDWYRSFSRDFSRKRDISKNDIPFRDDNIWLHIVQKIIKNAFFRQINHLLLATRMKGCNETVRLRTRLIRTRRRCFFFPVIATIA